ncbi:Lambda phage tail tape-measure protein [Roseovarius sp. THAF8]|uniref:phage tail length tape measure family protein n=1 Tax=Roseovarius sp. THAF8 TaxID=2587846 RepID=UPI0012A9F295|nr:phage tail length tape measure family protein [Roseovarius sp. THAF8]QFT97395.1 Lambda phage tail tape-measure protein [Roseovarius sp. THAF8]
MSETHELRLKVDASAAKRGSREFVGAVNAVKQAVRDLERDSAGAFTKLRKVDTSGLREVTREAQNASKSMQGTGTASDKAAAQIKRTALASASAMRSSEQAAQRLALRMGDLGNTSGLAELEGALSRLRSNLTNAGSTLDVRSAKSQFDDLRSSLLQNTVAAEHLRGEQVQLARQTEEAARAARQQASEMDRLREKYNPLYAASKAYERSIEEVAQAEQAGVISANMASAARERAAAQLGAASAANTRYAATARSGGYESAYFAAQMQDVFVSAQMGQPIMTTMMQQGFQFSAMLNQMGGRTAILKSLSGAMLSLVNPTTLATLAVVGGAAALTQWVMSAGGAEDATESLKRQLDTLSTLSTDLSATLDVLEMDAVQLAEKYGTAAIRARELAVAQAELRRGEIIDALKAQVAELGFIETRYKQAQGAAALYSSGIKNIATDFKISRAAAADFEGVLLRLGRAKTFDEQRAALQAIVKHAEEAGIELSQFPPELRQAAIHMIDLSNESDALQQLLHRASDAIAGATGQTNAWAGAMSGVRAEINAILSSLASIGGGVISNAAKSAELTALNAGNSVRAAAVARVRFEKEQEFAAKEMAANSAGGIAGWAQGQLLEMERYQFEESLRLDAELDAKRAAVRKAATSSGGGGGGGGGGSSSRTAALTEEQKAVTDLTESLQDRLTSLTEEKLALELVASGQFETREGARAMAEAQTTMGGAVDATTEALIRQIDAAQKSANEMRKAANAGAQGWLNAVPSYQEAADQIEVEVLDSLSNEISSFAQTGKFDFERLADSILATMADLAAKLAVKELFGGLLGGGGSGGSGGLLSGLFSGGDGGGFLAGLFSEGGYSTQAVAHSAVPAAAFKNAPHFSEGTANTSGIPSILHPNEAVIPLSKGRKVPVELSGDKSGAAGQMLNYAPTYNIQTPDADSFRRSQAQTAADGLSVAQRALRKNG